jgi:hypothetical protein
VRNLLYDINCKEDQEYTYYDFQTSIKIIAIMTQHEIETGPQAIAPRRQPAAAAFGTSTPHVPSLGENDGGNNGGSGSSGTSSDHGV